MVYHGRRRLGINIYIYTHVYNIPDAQRLVYLPTFTPVKYTNVGKVNRPCIFRVWEKSCEFKETHEATWRIYEFNQGNAVVFFPRTWIQVLMCFFRRKGPPTGFCIEKRHRSGVSTSKELVRDKNTRCHFWMDGKNWMVQVMVNEWIEWYHHVTSWSYIRSSSNLHSTAPFLLKMAQA